MSWSHVPTPPSYWLGTPGTQEQSPSPGQHRYLLQVVGEFVVRVHEEDVLRLEVSVREFVVMQNCGGKRSPVMEQKQSEAAPTRGANTMNSVCSYQHQFNRRLELV